MPEEWVGTCIELETGGGFCHVIHFTEWPKQINSESQQVLWYTTEEWSLDQFYPELGSEINLAMNGAYFYPIVEEGEVRDGLGHEGAHFIANWFAPNPADSYLHIPRIEEG